jgi:hypothetical protein
MLPQACHDPLDVRYLIAAEPPDVRRAGHLLFKGSAIFLCGRSILRGQSTADGGRKAEENPQRSHAGPFLFFCSFALALLFRRRFGAQRCGFRTAYVATLPAK